MKVYTYFAEFKKNVTQLKLGSRSASITEITREITPFHPSRHCFVVDWSNHDNESFTRTFNANNTFIISAYNGFVNYKPSERGRACYAFLNMLKRLEYENNK